MGKIITLTGASGAGKSSIAKEVLVRLPETKLVTSTTTRVARPSDLPGEYEYIAPLDFAKAHTNNEFLWAVYTFGNHYGTRRSVVDEIVHDPDAIGLMLLVEPSVMILRGYAGSAVLSFYIVSPSFEVLEARLRGRGDDKEAIKRRVFECVGQDEKALKSNVYDIYVRNDHSLEDAVREVVEEVEKCTRNCC